MVLVFKDNGIVELRDDDGRQTIRVFHDVKSCDEHWGKALLLLTYQSHNSVELRSSRNGLMNYRRLTSAVSQCFHCLFLVAFRYLIF